MALTAFLFMEWGWLLLVFLGFSFFIAAYYFRLQSKQLSRAIAKLYSLNQDLEHDALTFFEQAWPVLERVGCLQLKADVRWFGEIKNCCYGYSSSAKRLEYNLTHDDISFEIELFLNRNASDSESVASLVVKTFINILEQDVVLKQAQILASQKRIERYRLFVQHEIKNIAQYISLVSEQVESVSDDSAKIKLIGRLKQSLPTIAERASKMVKQLSSSKLDFYERKVFSVSDLIHEVMKMYSLQATVKGDAKLELPKQALMEVLKNILGNYQDHAVEPLPLLVCISNEDGVELKITIESPLNISQKEMLPERIFEPFWTTSESGLGLGMFLAREILKNIGGVVELELSTDSFAFVISVPVSSSKGL